MANELNIALSTGLTVTAQRYQAGAAVGSAISCPETGSTGFYSGNMTGTAGTYQVAFLSAGANVGSGSIVWSGTAEVPASTFNPATDTVANVTLCATTTTLTNAPASVTPSDIWSHASRTITGGTVTTLTNPPTVPTVVEIRQEMDSNSTKLANLNATVSSRLAASAYTAPTAAPTAAANATAVWSAATRTLTAGAGISASDVWSHATRTLTSASGPTASEIRTEIDSNSTQLSAIKAKTDNLPASPAATGDIPSANITAIKAKTDLLNTDRLAQCSTVATTGAQLAAALS